MRGIFGTVVGGACVLSAAAGALGQVSFVAVPVQTIAPGETRVLNTNAAGTLALLETPVPLNPPSTVNRRYSIVRPNGSNVTMWSSVVWNPVTAVSDSGAAVWAHSAVLGSMLRVTSQVQVEDFDVDGFVSDVSGDERFVVGYRETAQGLVPFRWDRDTGEDPTLLAGTSGRPWGAVAATTADGEYACGFTEIRGGWSTVGAVATVWRASGEAVALPYPTGMDSSFAVAVDRRGGTVGYAYVGLGLNITLVQWPAGGGVRLLPMAGGGGYVTDVSLDGRVVAGYLWRPSGDSSATVWLDGVAHNVRTYLTELGVTGLDGWWLGDSIRVSDDGRRICGTGVNAQGGCIVYFATIPGVCTADMGRVGGEYGGDGVLDNNDFIAFIGEFFAGNAPADVGSAGGLPGGDGVLDNNDFIAFMSAFFEGC